MKNPSASPGTALVPSAYRIEDTEFRQFQALVERETGIQLPESKRALLVGRLSRRLRELGLASFGAYYRHLHESGDEAEFVRFIDRMATNETSFFREPRQFEFLEQEVLPAWIARTRGRRLRAWSAACSTGEEPYSIAMTLLSRLPLREVEVLASDISTRALEAARAALWPIERSRQVPERHLKGFMLRGVGEYQGYMKAAPELREAVRFERLNLHEPHYPVDGPFDLIFCRNVLIYFNAEGRAAVVRRLLKHLAPGGFLFLGHAETLNGITDGLRSVGPTVYGWKDGPSMRPSLPARTYSSALIGDRR